MSKNQSNSQENINSLKSLLKTELRERADLAGIVHSIAGNISIMKIWLKHLEPTDKSKIESYSTLMELMQTSVDDTRAVMEKLYPRVVLKMGMVNSLMKVCDDLSTKYDSKINLISKVAPHLQIDGELQVEVYNLCSCVLEFLCIVQADEIDLTVDLEKQILQIELNGKGVSQKALKNPEAINMLSFVKAWSLVINVEVLDKTNWKNFFIFRFSLKEPKAK